MNLTNEQRRVLGRWLGGGTTRAMARCQLIRLGVSEVDACKAMSGALALLISDMKRAARRRWETE